MIDGGLLDPLIAVILHVVKSDPLKIAIGTAILATVVSLDGDKTTTFMITISAMLPLYKKNRREPACFCRHHHFKFRDHEPLAMGRSDSKSDDRPAFGYGGSFCSGDSVDSRRPSLRFCHCSDHGAERM